MKSVKFPAFFSCSITSWRWSLSSFLAVLHLDADPRLFSCSITSWRWSPSSFLAVLHLDADPRLLFLQYYILTLIVVFFSCSITSWRWSPSSFLAVLHLDADRRLLFLQYYILTLIVTIKITVVFMRVNFYYIVSLTVACASAMVVIAFLPYACIFKRQYRYLMHFSPWVNTVIAEIFVSVNISYSSVRELSYAINFHTARTVSHTLLYVHGFRMLLNISYFQPKVRN